LRPIKRLKVRRPARLNGDERFSNEIFRNYGRGETRPLITQSRKDSRYIGQRFGDCKVFVQVVVMAAVAMRLPPAIRRRAEILPVAGSFYRPRSATVTLSVA
jgi:hypothetical protein